MLTEILMEALMSMDDDTLTSVLESCDSEELDIINSAMEDISASSKKILVKGPGNNPLSKAVFNATRVMNNLNGYSDEVSALIPNEERRKLIRAVNTDPDALYHKELSDTVKSLGRNGTKSKINDMTNKVRNTAAEINRKRGYEYNPFSKSLEQIPGAPEITSSMAKNLQDRERTVQSYSKKASNLYNELEHKNSSKILNQYIKSTQKRINEINAASPNNSSTSAKIGKALHSNVSDLIKKSHK